MRALSTDTTRPVVLLTGFGPFPGIADNVTGTLVPHLAKSARKLFPHPRFVTDILPTEWDAGPRRLDELMSRHRPLLSLHFGVDAGADGFKIETQGANECAAREDARAALPPQASIVTDGPARLSATLPVEVIVAALKSRGLPVSISDSAGRYLCNAILYRSLWHCTQPGRFARSGFVHLPHDLEQGPLSFDQALEGSLAIIAACLDE